MVFDLCNIFVAKSAGVGMLPAAAVGSACLGDLSVDGLSGNLSAFMAGLWP